jgi:hypothetical protein
MLGDQGGIHRNREWKDTLGVAANVCVHGFRWIRPQIRAEAGLRALPSTVAQFTLARLRSSPVFFLSRGSRKLLQGNLCFYECAALVDLRREEVRHDNRDVVLAAVLIRQVHELPTGPLCLGARTE